MPPGRAGPVGPPRVATLLSPPSSPAPFATPPRAYPRLPCRRLHGGGLHPRGRPPASIKMNYLILNLVIFNRIISEIIYAPASARGYFPLLLPLRLPFPPSLFSLYPLPPRIPPASGSIGMRRRFFSKSSPPTVSSWIIAASATYWRQPVLLEVPSFVRNSIFSKFAIARIVSYLF